jgi:transposase
MEWCRMKPDDKYIWARSFPIHVGVDTGKVFHKLVVRGPDGRRQKAFKVLVSRPGFDETHAYLRTTFPNNAPGDFLVGLEFAGHHGYTFAQFLAQKGYTVVSVMPAHTKRTKEIEDNSPNKNDDKDAQQICKLTGDGIFVPFPLLEPIYTQLKMLVVHRHRLTVEQTRFKNRLQTTLDLAWPEYLAHFSNLTKRTPIALLERWPLPQDLAAAAPVTVMRFVKKTSHGQVRPANVKKLLESARETVGLTSGADERRRELKYLFERWRMLREQMADLDERIASAVARCPEARALTTIPEVSHLCAATIVAELGTPGTFVHPAQVLKLAGMNLVGRDSGVSVSGRRWQSKRGRPMLRRQLYLLAGRWSSSRGLLREEYLAMVQRNGQLKTKAVCAMARKLVPVLFEVMKSGQAFDAERYLRNKRLRTA